MRLRRSMRAGSAAAPENERSSGVASPPRSTKDQSIHSKEFTKPTRDQSEGTSDGHHLQVARATRLPPRLTRRCGLSRYGVARSMRYVRNRHHLSELCPSRSGERHQPVRCGVRLDGRRRHLQRRLRHRLRAVRRQAGPVEAAGCDGEGYTHHQGRHRHCSRASSAGNPPDVIDNCGADQIGFNSILDQLAELNDVIEAKNFEGKVSRTRCTKASKPGTFDGKFIALNYVLTVYALWYSATSSRQNGWTVPKTYDEMLALGAEAKGKGKYLLGWGKEAATYYQTMAIASAIKEGGDEVRLALENSSRTAGRILRCRTVFNGLNDRSSTPATSNRADRVPSSPLPRPSGPRR